MSPLPHPHSSPVSETFSLVSLLLSAMASGDLRAELECSVCLNIYTDPVTLRCGHNFCRVCIDGVLDTQEGSGGYSCPECREKFPDRPALQKNMKLRNIAETFLSTHQDQEESGVFCTYCVDSPVPAVRSCLLCEVSLCDKHLRVHKKSPEHVLCDPTLSMESRKCSVHKEVLKYFCTEDGSCVCMSCYVIGGHKGHEMKSLDEASEKKKKTLRNVLQKLLTKREKTEEKVQSLQEHRRKVEEEAAGDTKRVTALFRDLRRRLEDLEKRVLRDISGRAERISISIRDLEIKKEELSRKLRHIEELCNVTDPLTVLQESDTGDLCDTEDGDNEDRERHEELLHDGGGLDVAGVLHTGLSDIITEVNVYFPIQGAADILLDGNTAHNILQISSQFTFMIRRENGKRKQEILVTPSQNTTNYCIRELSSASLCVGGRHPSPIHSSPVSESFSFVSLLLSAMASGDLRAELECSVCLNIYTDPVMLRCGHNFCRVCIDRVLDTQEGSGGYSCPECREKFQDRPALQKNMKLRNIAETFLSTQPDQEKSGVFCTYCVDSPVPAVRSCLLCEVSLCDKHLRVHKNSPEHVLCDPTLSMESRKCSVHKKILEYYCTEDETCICVSCSLAGEHRGHQVETLDEASEKKKTLRNVLQKLLTKREETEERVQSLQEHQRKVEEEAAGDTERVTALFTDLRRRLEDLEKRVLRDISGRAERISISIRDLEIKKEELSRKLRHIEELCNVTDPLTVLQESDTGDLCDTEDGDNEDRERHEELLHDGGGLDVAGVLHTGLSDIITEVNVYFYIQGAADILLDRNTANNYLQISDDRKTVSRSDRNQNHPETPERFQYSQVLSSRSFSSGRHYWEVDVGGSESWRVGMCYPSIKRRGGESVIGNNKKSWGLVRYNNQYYVRHDRNKILLPTNPSSNRVRIYLDYEAGRISFYDLCDPIRHLHTFTTTFTEPLHAGIAVYGGCIKICGGRREM
ncbi:LOW QUALITY PROTEIN: E3 ubiquitin/ISG15 ligase TRIM25-like [Lithobates pipiens]